MSELNKEEFCKLAEEIAEILSEKYSGKIDARLMVILLTNLAFHAHDDYMMTSALMTKSILQLLKNKVNEEEKKSNK